MGGGGGQRGNAETTSAKSVQGTGYESFPFNGLEVLYVKFKCNLAKKKLSLGSLETFS